MTKFSFGDENFAQGIVSAEKVSPDKVCEKHSRSTKNDNLPGYLRAGKSLIVYQIKFSSLQS